MQLLELFQEETYKSCPNDLAIYSVPYQDQTWRIINILKALSVLDGLENRKQVCS